MNAADPVRPQGHYQPAVVTGNTVISAGMTPRVGDALAVSGRVGSDDHAGDVSVKEAAVLAGQAIGRAIDACRQVLPEGAQLTRPTALTVYVRASVDFTRHSEVADGASVVLAQRFGGHVPARAAIGVSSLPGGAPVEVVLAVEWAVS